MQWQYVAKSPVPGDNFNLLMCIVIMLLDAVVYALITWYVEAVFPGMLIVRSDLLSLDCFMCLRIFLYLLNILTHIHKNMPGLHSRLAYDNNNNNNKKHL